MGGQAARQGLTRVETGSPEADRPATVQQVYPSGRSAPADRAVTLRPEALVAKPNYGFQKRQKELAKQEKRQLKAEKKASRLSEAAEPGSDGTEATPPEQE